MRLSPSCPILKLSLCNTRARSDGSKVYTIRPADIREKKKLFASVLTSNSSSAYTLPWLCDLEMRKVRINFKSPQWCRYMSVPDGTERIWKWRTCMTEPTVYAVCWPIGLGLHRNSTLCQTLPSGSGPSHAGRCDCPCTVQGRMSWQYSRLQFSLWWRLSRNGYIYRWSPGRNVSVEFMLSNSKAIKLMVQVGETEEWRAC